jgi:single-strand DNA-binding protein
MANETNLTIVGYLTADPELKSTSSGLAVVNLTIASTPTKYDKNTNDWVNGETTFLRASAWRTFAEQIAASLKKGDKVIALGRLVTQSYLDKDGNNRSSMQLELESLGLDLSRPPKSGYSEVPKSDSSGSFQPPADWTKLPELDANSPF